MDYYSLLELDSKTATHEQIAQAYRKLSVLNHPLRDEANQACLMRKFNQLCEAYAYNAACDNW